MATGQVDDADLGLLRSSQRSRLLLALSAILTWLSRSEDVLRPAPEKPTRPATAWRLLAGAQERAPEAVEAVLSDPCVGSWAFPLLRRLRHGAAAVGSQIPAWAEASLFAALTGAAAVRADMRVNLRVPAYRGRLWLPSLGVTDPVGRGDWAVVTLEHGPSGTLVLGDQGSVRLPQDPARPADGWHPLPRPDGTGPALDHLSPFRDFRFLTDPVSLAPRTLERWHGLLAESDALLRRTQPDAHRLVTAMVRTVVPVEGPSELRAVSATAPDAPGAVTLSLPLDASAMSAVLIHEARHHLLSSLAELVPLFLPVHEGPEPTYFAPWRADPRPLRGLLFGAHAFTGVLSYWQARTAVEPERAEFEFTLHHRQLGTALASLEDAPGLSRAGALVVEGLAAFFRRTPAPEPAHTAARRSAELSYDAERAVWRAAHLAVEPEEAVSLAQRFSSGRPPPAELPHARIRPPGSGASGPSGREAARTWLARLWCTDRESFADVRRQIDEGQLHPLGIKGATLGDVLLVSGDTEAALDWFRRQPSSPETWAGIGLAQRTDAARLLVERPEIVLALHTALRRLGTQPSGPEALAGWLASRPAPSDSDAERVDVAVGPDAVGGVPGGLVLDAQHPAE
ncbi:aKG-HExxH-type peptide beta-hydroxylase [Streptomyces lanatus]|uniref:HEXXH motif-containing putative peptide modification protein n=1 Tax=Streptomyces lanatus TaxID=66900 RepID=A0ABV1Y7D9_9ACTN|nr:HEXXH motif-containing putative peptide modification protein [Streptomyces lanatus]